MQFIQELSLYNKAALGAAVALVLVVLLVALKRKRQAKPADAAPKPRRMRRKGAAEADRAPRRKRRKLAAEAARSMGLDAAPETAFPEVPAVPVAPAPVAKASVAVEVAPESAPAAEVVEAAAAPADATLQDPYVQPAGPVAQPGWPAPGELASSFDPDAFDPLPELEHDATPEMVRAAAHGEIGSAIDMTDVVDMDVPSADVEWADEVEAGWDDADYSATETWITADAVEAAPDEREAEAPAAEPTTVEQFWGEPDTESAWDDEAGDEIAEIAFDVKDEAGNDVVESAWNDGAPDVSWEHEKTTFETPAPGATSAFELADVPPAEPAVSLGAWTGATGTPTSPVVLDLAGLAASGQSLELVIEPNADGQGVRLRIGSPSAHEATPVAEVSEEQLPVEPIAAPPAEEANHDAPSAEADEELDVTSDAWGAVEEDAWDATPEAELGDDAAENPSFELPAEIQDLAVAETPTVSFDAYSEPAEPITYEEPVDETAFAEEEPTPAVPEDDPAKILADIRARLAALDASR